MRGLSRRHSTHYAAGVAACNLSAQEQRGLDNMASWLASRTCKLWFHLRDGSLICKEEVTSEDT